MGHLYKQRNNVKTTSSLFFRPILANQERKVYMIHLQVYTQLNNYLIDFHGDIQFTCYILMNKKAEMEHSAE